MFFVAGFLIFAALVLVLSRYRVQLIDVLRFCLLFLGLVFLFLAALSTESRL